MRTRHSSSGFSLIEVLIAVGILAFGLLALAKLQISAMGYNHMSNQYTVGAGFAQNILERMRANRPGLLAGNYSLAAGSGPANPTKDCSASGTSCAPDELAAWDLAVWYSSISSSASFTNIPSGPSGLLPTGSASITCQDNPCLPQSVRLITIYWDPSNTTAAATTYGCGLTPSTDFNCLRLPYVP